MMNSSYGAGLATTRHDIWYMNNEVIRLMSERIIVERFHDVERELKVSLGRYAYFNGVKND